MNVNIELYASLMKRLPPGRSRFKREIRVEEGLVVSALVKQFNIKPEEAHIVLVDGKHVHGDQRETRVLVEGETVSIWPPVG